MSLARLFSSLRRSELARQRALEVEGLVFELRWSARRRTVEIAVDRRGGLRIAAPEGCPISHLEGFARQRLPWVRARLAAREALGPPPAPRAFVDGELFPYLGGELPLRIVSARRPSLALGPEGFRLARAVQARARGHFVRWYRERTREWVAGRIAERALAVGRSPARVLVREMGRRWGSCAHDGRLAFNWRLTMLPPELGDYVVVHELAHLVEHNHSRRFWGQVERILPDWRERRAALARRALELAWTWE